MRMALRSLTALALVGMGGLAVTCSVYDSSLVDGPGGAPNNDASDECVLATFPPHPTSSGQGSADIDVVTALDDFDFGEEYAQVDLVTLEPIKGQDNQPQIVPERPVGFDLDQLCTKGPGEGNPKYPSLKDPGSCRAVADWITKLDGDISGGRDNALRNVIKVVATQFPGFGTQFYKKNIQDGKVSLILRVQHYNGQPNDDKVDITVYTPSFFTDGGQNTGLPQFKGDDTWPIAADSFAQDDPQRPVLTGTGYVNNGVVVGNLKDMDFRLRIGISPEDIVNIRVVLKKVFLTGRLTLEKPEGLPERWAIRQGQIAGIWPTHELLSSVKFYPNPTHADGQPVKMCMNGLFYPVIRGVICSAADIPVSQEGTPDPTCDGMSVGIGFEGVQAKLGKVVPAQQLVNDCGYLDPAFDSCDHAYTGKERGDGPPPKLQQIGDGGS